MAITEKQRHLILDRDDHTSQLLHYNEEKGWHRGGYCGEGCDSLHVHHIEPVRIGRLRGKTREEIDDPRNLITTFKCEHVGICDKRRIGRNEKYVSPSLETPVIHEDVQYATMNYKGKSKYTSFDVMIELRGEAIQEGSSYWNRDWDSMMRGIAEERTQCAACRGWKFYSIR